MRDVTQVHMCFYNGLEPYTLWLPCCMLAAQNAYGTLPAEKVTPLRDQIWDEVKISKETKRRRALIAA